MLRFDAPPVHANAIRLEAVVTSFRAACRARTPCHRFRRQP